MACDHPDAFSSGLPEKGIDLQMRYDLGRGSYLNLNYTMIDIDLTLGGQSVMAWRQPKDCGMHFD